MSRVLSIILTVVCVFASIGCIARTDAQCFGLVKKYYECQKLANMTKLHVKRSLLSSDEPNDRPANILDDTFYSRNLALQNMNFDQGMGLIKQIYQDISTCENELCNCVLNINDTQLKSHIKQLDPMAIFFESENFADTKKIIVSLDQSLSASRLNNDELSELPFFGGGQNLPTLTQFCITNEFANIRASEYKDFWECIKHDDSAWSSCLWQTHVSNREVISNPTSLQMQSQMVCELLAARSCSAEKKLFLAMNTWATKFARITWNRAELSVRQFLENLVQQASNFKPQVVYSSVNMVIQRDQYHVRSFKHGFVEFSSSFISFVLLKTNHFQALAKVGFDERRNLKFFQSIDVTSQESFFKLDESLLNEPANRTNIIKNGRGENVFQVVVYMRPGVGPSVDLFDFNTNSIISWSFGNVQIVGPINWIQQSTGVLVEGPRFFNS